MMYFSLQDDLAEWTDFLRYIDKNYPRVQLDIFNESGNLVVAQKKNQKMPRLIWCDTFEPLLLDHDESQNKKLLWIFECTLHIVGMNSNMLSEEEFKEFYMKYYNSNSPIF